MKKLSILIPVYNEEKTIKHLLKKVLDVKLGDIKKDIIIIDDGSTDGTKTFLKNVKDKRIKILSRYKNEGKGFAIKQGLSQARGDIILIQDADLEYNPKDYNRLIRPIIKKESKIVYGSRNLETNDYIYFSYYLGGKFLTWFLNLLYGSKLTDEATGYKAFDTQVINKVSLKCSGFEFCPEVTVKLLKKGYNILEVPISYSPRNKKEGKKINWLDGLKAIYIIIKYKFVK